MTQAATLNVSVAMSATRAKLVESHQHIIDGGTAERSLSQQAVATAATAQRSPVVVPAARRNSFRACGNRATSPH